jgi:hypothetical protein
MFAASIGGPRLPVAFASYKALAAKSSIDFSKSELELANGYEELEATEKANLSYWTGMTIASILADFALGVPRLLHASSYAPLVGRDPSSKSLADLIGQDARGDWHVIEAKARQTVTERGRAAWKAQATTIASIGSRVPMTMSYSLARLRTPLRAELVDPTEHNGERVNIELGDHGFRGAYYGPLREWSREGVPVRRAGRELRLRIAAYDALEAEFMWVGLETRLLSTEAQDQPDRDEVEVEDAFIGSDGVAIATSPEADIPNDGS